jgi:sirohydrochlorin cobaltochelatase
VSHEDFADAALVLLGHGTTLNSGSAAPVFQHAAELRARACFAAVREAFWKQEPRLAGVLSSLDAPRIFIAPLFISEGYFSERLIPRALGFRGAGPEGFCRARRQGGQTLFYCKPVGTHESMTGALLARAREVVGRFPSRRGPALKETTRFVAGRGPGRGQDARATTGLKETTLFVAGHGTGRDPNSRRAIERQVQLIRAMDLYADVQGVFLEEEPRIGRCWELAATRRLVVVPFFISDGLHVQEDIPVMLGEAKSTVRRRLGQGHPAWRNPTKRDGKRLWLSSSVGTEPDLAVAVLGRVREAASWADSEDLT